MYIQLHVDNKVLVYIYIYNIAYTGDQRYNLFYSDLNYGEYILEDTENQNIADHYTE